MRIIPVVDLFAGPGGLGEGFSALDVDGEKPFHIVCSVEKEESAHSTLTLRAFFRQCLRRSGLVPDEYYAYLRGSISREDLFKSKCEFAKVAKAETLEGPRALGSDNGLIYERIGQQLARHDGPWVLIGGPPCQAYSLVGRSRNRGVSGYRIEDDPRSGLYREYLQIVNRFHPEVFIMENVKGMLSARLDGKSVIYRILDDLSRPSKALGRENSGPRYRIFSLAVSKSNLFSSHFDPREFVIRSEYYGIPQGRHRVILFGVREDVETTGCELTLNVSDNGRCPDLKSVLTNLPRLRSGLSRETDSQRKWLECLNQIKSEIQANRSDPAITLGVLRQVELASNRWNQPSNNRGGRFIRWSASYNPTAALSADMASWLLDKKLGGFLNHETRGHIREDLARYLFCIAHARSNHWTQFKSPKLNGFPAFLMPDHDAKNLSNFTDRFRVQNPHGPGTTVTSHISKDGHYYIHPDITQVRSFTVREAARVQTFPDNYFFEGTRTQQYVQVGNAVPPLLANKIARIVSGILN